MISAYCLIPIGIGVAMLILWLISENSEKNEYRTECMKWESRFMIKEGRIQSLEKLLAEKRKNEKQPMKMTIDVELNTDQLQGEIDKIKHIIGICKHQDKCAFFEIGGERNK